MITEGRSTQSFEINNLSLFIFTGIKNLDQDIIHAIHAQQIIDLRPQLTAELKD